MITNSIVLVIPFLISGPFLPDLVVSISSLIFLYHVFKNKHFSYFNNKPMLIFFIFCVYAIFCSLISKNILLSFESSLFYFRIGIFACLIWYLIDCNRKILNYFYYTLLICFLSLVIDGYIQFFTGKNILGNELYAGVRVSSFFKEELILGSYLSRLFPLLFALFLIKKKIKYEHYFIGVLFILIDVLIYISGERAAFAFLNLSTIFIIILINKYQKFRFIILFISLIIISLLTYLNGNMRDRMISEPVKTMGFINKNDYGKNSKNLPQKKYIFTPTHDSLIRTALKMFIDKPVFGHGPKMFRIKCKEKKYQIGINPCQTHPHNFYIQLLAETGIVGFGFLFAVFSYIIYVSYRQIKSIILKQKRYLTDYQVCLLAGILITVWPISPNGNFFNNWLAIIYSLPFGFYLQSIYDKKKLVL